MSTPAIIEATPEHSDSFRSFVRQAQQAAYPRPELDITADLFSEEIFNQAEAIALFAGYCAVTESNRAWMAIDETGDIVGTVGAIFTEGYCDQHSLYVAPGQKGRGIGRALFNQVLGFAESRPIRVDVADYMTETQAIYEHWGFLPAPQLGKPNCIWWKYWPEEAAKNFQFSYMVRPSGKYQPS